MSTDHYLEIYLNDHRAAETALVRLSQRVLRNNRSSPWVSDLEQLYEAIQEDADELDRVAEAAGARGGSLKRIAAIVGERAGRLKLNGHVLTYSPLSRLLELEGLMAALELKRNMWAALDSLLADRPAMSAFDKATMKQRAASQHDIVGPIHEWAATELARSEGG